MDFALVHKERPKVHQAQKKESMLVGDVRGRNCVLVDDITDTSYTITKAARLLREKGAQDLCDRESCCIICGCIKSYQPKCN